MPEVNPRAIAGYTKKGIIANPNCSTIQMVVAVNPIHQKVGVKRLVVSTYQAVSGSGQKGILELESQIRALMNFKTAEKKLYPHRIAFNVLPHIDVFQDNGYTKEEMKMVNETRKIIGDESIMVTATTVRVPVFYSHSEAVNLTLAGPMSADEARELLANSPGIKVVDAPELNQYPLAADAAGQDLTLVGRIRKDISQENGLDMWIVPTTSARARRPTPFRSPKNWPPITWADRRDNRCPDYASTPAYIRAGVLKPSRVKPPGRPRTRSGRPCSICWGRSSA